MEVEREGGRGGLEVQEIGGVIRVQISISIITARCNELLRIM